MHQEKIQQTEYKRSPDNPKRWRISISCSKWFSKNFREKLRIPRTTLRRESTVRIENLSEESHGDGEEFQTEETKDDEGINKDFWAHAEARKEFQLSSSYWTEKFNCTCREKNHILFHCVILMSPGQLVQIWRLLSKNEFLIIGMSIRTEICQIRGRVSQDIRYLSKLL